jgi:hypothetical protein
MTFLRYVMAIYDFRTDSVIEPKVKGEIIVSELPTLGSGRISNLQYDLESDSLTYFDNGKILSVAIQR